MTRALIGHTGFVGSNLLRQAPFDDLYNSANIGTIAGREFDLLVCSGARAEKWKAAQDPEADWKGISSLMQALENVKATKAILISTIDVYPSPKDVDESSPIDGENNHPYGKHRYRLEQFFRDRYDALILRLPGLFGPGLKKNVIFDFLNNNNVSAVNSEGVFQFYDLGWLWPDITKAQAERLELINLSTEPVSVREIADECFGMKFDNALPNPARYDFRSRHFAHWGGRDGYLRTRATVMEAMRTFVKSEQAARTGKA
jgi:nucleoside-diphosphate-sugar epimerase